MSTRKIVPDWLTWAFPAASLTVSVLAPWIATARARVAFEAAVDTKFAAQGMELKAIQDRLDAQDKSVERQFQSTQSAVKEALEKLYAHERDIGGIVASMASMNVQRGYSSGR